MTSPILMKAALSESQQACVDLLREALAEAERGTFHSIAMACCLEAGFATVMAGTQAADLNLACDDLKHKIHAAVTEGNVKRASKIIRAKQ